MTSSRRSILWFAIQSSLIIAADANALALRRVYLNVSSSSLTTSTTSAAAVWSPVPDLLASIGSDLISTSTSLLLSRSHTTTLTTISVLPTTSQRGSGRVLTEASASESVPPSSVNSTTPITAPPVSTPFLSSNLSAPSTTGPGVLLNSSSSSPIKTTSGPPYGNSSSINTSVVSIFVPPPATTATATDCTTLSPGEAVTSWIFLPNTTTVTLTVTANWSTTYSLAPEFTPPTYCPAPAAPYTWPALTFTPATAKTTKSSAGESSGTSTAVVATTYRLTTTVITTSKNPPTVFTTASIPDYGGNTDKQSVTASSYVDTYIWGPLPQPTFTSTIPDSGSIDTGQSTQGPGSQNTQNPSPPYTTVYNGDGSNPGPITETVGGITVVVSSTQAVIGGQTISIGGGDKTVTEGGDVFTVNPSQVIGPSIIVNVPTQAGGQFLQTPTPTTVQGISIDLNPSTAVIAGTSYRIGDGAPQETIVAKGQTITVGSAGVIFSATTVAPPGGQPTNVVIVDGEVFSAVGSDTAVIGGKTFTYSPGAPAQTDVFNGETITIGPQGVSFDGTTLGGIAHPTGTQLGIAGGLSVTEIGSTLAIVNGHTLTIGPSAPTTTLVINGQTITAGPSGLSVGGATLTAPFNQPTETVTAGGITFSEIGSSLAVIGSKTFTFGPGATTTTDVFNGQTISIGPSGIGFATTTFTGATSNPTAAQSHTKNGVERVTLGNGVLGMGFMFGVAFFL